MAQTMTDRPLQYGKPWIYILTDLWISPPKAKNMQNSRIVRQFIKDVLHQGRVDAAEQFFWENRVELIPLSGQGPGLEGHHGNNPSFLDLASVIPTRINSIASSAPTCVHSNNGEIPLRKMARDSVT